MPALNRITTSTRPSPPSAARLLALALAPFSPAPRLLRARAFHGDPQGPTSGFHPGPPTSSTWRIAGTQSGPSAPLLVARAVNSAAAAAAAATVAATAALGRRRTPARALPSFSLPLLYPSRRPGLCGGVASPSSSRAIHLAAGHRPSIGPRKEGCLAGASSSSSVADRSSAGGGGGAFVPLANQKAQQPLRTSSSCASSTPFWTAGPTRSPARPAPAASTSESLESSQSLGPDEQRPPAPAFSSGGVRGQQQEQQQQEQEHYPKAAMEEGEPAKPAASAPSVGDDAVASATTTPTAGGHEGHPAGDGAGASPEGVQSSETPLPLPAPGEGDGSSGSTTTTTIEVNGKAVMLDQLGPMVVGRDGTLSRIANWGEMAQIERQNTLRILGKRNQLRLGALRAAAEAPEKQD